MTHPLWSCHVMLSVLMIYMLGFIPSQTLNLPFLLTLILQATQSYDRVLQLCSGNAAALTNYAICQVFLGKPDIALQHLDLAGKKKPTCPTVTHTVMVLVRQLRESWGEIVHLKRVLDCFLFYANNSSPSPWIDKYGMFVLVNCLFHYVGYNVPEETFTKVMDVCNGVTI